MSEPATEVVAAEPMAESEPTPEVVVAQTAAEPPTAPVQADDLAPTELLGSEAPAEAEQASE